MSFVGNLQELGLGEILQIVSLSRKSGTLTIRSEGRTGTIVFRQGQVVRASSTTFRQTLGGILLQRGAVTQEILEQALALQQADSFKERLGIILHKHFNIPQEIIADVVRQQIEGMVYSMFEWSAGTYEFLTQDNVETIDGTRIDPLQFTPVQGLNPQLLALEGARMAGDRTGQDEISAVDTCSTVVPSELAEENIAASAADVGTGQLLLVVDDDAPTMNMIKEGLEPHGFDVRSLAPGYGTLSVIESLIGAGQSPLLLVDMIMPKLDGSGVLGGLELLERLQENYKQLPAVVISDFRFSDAESRVSAMGFDFIVKPRRAEVRDEQKCGEFLSALVASLRRLEEKISQQ